jgi:hypothetical protein
MSERWKYQIKMGGIWGIYDGFQCIVTSKKSISEQVATPNFYI